MIDLNLKLEKNRHYINYGSIFSRLLLLSDQLNTSDTFLMVVENEKLLNTYLKISEYLKIEMFNLDNLSDLVDFLYNKTGKYVVTKDFFNLNIDNFKQLEYSSIFSVQSGQEIKIDDITQKLNDFGYHFSEFDNENTFRVSGDLLSFTNHNGITTKISFWGDSIEEIFIANKKVDSFYFGKIELLDFIDVSTKVNDEIIDKIHNLDSLVILDSLDFFNSYDAVSKYLNNYIIFNSLSDREDYVNLGINDLYIEKIEDFKNLLEVKGVKKYIFTKNRNTIKNFMELNNLSGIEIFDTNLLNLKSFRLNNHPLPPPYQGGGKPQDDIIVICDDNISRIFVKKRIKRSLSKNLDLMLQINPGDYIVHIDHGIGIFREIVTKELPSASGKDFIRKEYITIEYKNNDKLFVPITEVSRVSKYVGVDNPKLTGLSTKEWEKKLKKVAEDVEIIAKELLEVYAKRKLIKGYKFKSLPKEEVVFANSFNYVYTEDQLHVISDIYKDMESENPMDRLLSGDVGFGKTEIAFASIYKSIINGKQAVLISPLVVLAYEHYEKAIDRFKDFPINIGVVTRFEKPSVIKATLERLKTGKIDLIIGTHRLLSEDIKFKDLGLLVVDEEHKFGVKDKEKIKLYKGNIDILSMSATPIPRSLNMALNGIKSVSMLTTPPVGRQSIQTVVVPFDDQIIFDAGKREFDRKGQLFFIHNRVETINAVGNHLAKIFPGKKIVIAHGQLPGDALEKRIIEFKRKQFDILLATTVVENGIDFSNVNTIFINDAQNFGISQIHQLRGRVGRSDRKGYCYLLFKKDKIKEDAAKRLKTIVDYSHLGAGFELAIKDLEIRGGGDILGIRQSGQGHEIGVNLFLEMLEDKVEELKNEVDIISTNIDNNDVEKNVTKGKRVNTSIDLNIAAYIDDSYFGSELDKINFYREIESLDSMEDLENIINDFRDINRDTPIATNNFFNLLKLKLKAGDYMITSIKKVGINYQIDFKENISLDTLKEFLVLDKEVKFAVVNVNRLRSNQKNFANEEKFLQYMLQVFFEKKSTLKIKLKRN
ncbi:MAG: CarD family transcriptional regulator [Candidatus Gracilibacteria bacterium]|nr:CarD family transcriptional regulator [Candidatus Gracilibacteria bacterium]